MGQKEAQNNIPILLLQTDVAAGTCLQEQNTIPIPRVSDWVSVSEKEFGGKLFQGCKGW